MTADRSETGVPKPVTVSHIFGEIVWLLSQSSRHAAVTAAEMNWLLMPPILHRQFHIFREGERPIGAAIWAMLEEAGEQKVMKGLRETGSQLEDAEWAAGDRLWLIELIAPFATVENRHAELMMADLITGPFSKRAFKMLSKNPDSGESQVVSIPSDMGERLVQGTLEKMEGSSPCQ